MLLLGFSLGSVASVLSSFVKAGIVNCEFEPFSALIFLQICEDGVNGFSDDTYAIYDCLLQFLTILPDMVRRFLNSTRFTKVLYLLYLNVYTLYD